MMRKATVWSSLWLLNVFLLTSNGQDTDDSCLNPRTNLNTSSGTSASIGSSVSLESVNCTWSLSVNDDSGYFELSTTSIDNDAAVVWTSSSLQDNSKSGAAPYELELTVAGNVRFESDYSDILWETDTTNAGERPYMLEIGSNGDLVLTDDDNDEIWSLC